MIPIKNKSTPEMENALDFVRARVPVDYLSGDGEKGFFGLRKYCERYHIKTFWSSSPFTRHNAIIDSAIRGIRDKIPGLFEFADIDKMNQFMNIRNNSPHEAFNNNFSPKQVQNTLELECEFIRKKQQELREVKGLQEDEGLFDYKEGNVLLIYLDLRKTKFRFRKKRGVFNEIAEFIRYSDGNVVCRLLDPFDDIKVVELPIQFTQFVADNLDDLPDEYKKLLPKNKPSSSSSSASSSSASQAEIDSMYD
jgi:hypothetical protein